MVPLSEKLLAFGFTIPERKILTRVLQCWQKFPQLRIEEIIKRKKQIPCWPLFSQPFCETIILSEPPQP